MFCRKRIGLYAKLPAFGTHLLHDHLVILLQVGTFDDTYQGIGVVLRRGVTASLDAGCPTTIVIGREVADIPLIAGGHEDFGMVLIALSHIIILLEVLVGLVVIGKYIVAVVRALHSEVVVGGLRQGALTIG